MTKANTSKLPRNDVKVRRAGTRMVLAAWFLLVLLFSSCGAAFAQFQSDDTRSLGDIARETRERKRLASSDQSAHSAVVQKMVADIGASNDPDEYEGHLRELLSKQEFESLEWVAGEARSSKSRFPGGVWKLFYFYQAVSQPPGGQEASDANWYAHITLLKEWIARQPHSTTARIALGQAYLYYADKARGSGAASTVVDEGWRLLAQRSNRALEALEEAAAQPVKCPYWFEAMVQLAVNLGWSKTQTKGIVDSLISFEPHYYHVYREYALYLLPKWYGNEGDTEAFAESISQTLGGQEGAFVYFEIATLTGCGSCGDQSAYAHFSWPKVKEGYAALETLYGTSKLKMNRFALLAAKAQDKSAAAPVFARIGEDWDPDVWTYHEGFEAAKLWASK